MPTRDELERSVLTVMARAGGMSEATIEKFRAEILGDLPDESLHQIVGLAEVDRIRSEAIPIALDVIGTKGTGIGFQRLWSAAKDCGITPEEFLSMNTFETDALIIGKAKALKRVRRFGCEASAEGLRLLARLSPQRGRPSRFTADQLRQAEEAKQAGKTNNVVATILYGRHPTPDQRRSVPTILKYRRARKK